MGRTLVMMSLISVSEMDASVPGGDPRRERRRLVKFWIGSGGGEGGGGCGVSDDLDLEEVMEGDGAVVAAAADDDRRGGCWVVVVVELVLV